MKRTQAEKLSAVLSAGSMAKITSEDAHGEPLIQFTPTTWGAEKYGLKCIVKPVKNPFELIDHIYFNYLQKTKKY